MWSSECISSFSGSSRLAISWMINYQLGRRNILPEQQSYLRGVQYEREKGKVGGSGTSANTKKLGNSDASQTAKRLASQHKVSQMLLS